MLAACTCGTCKEGALSPRMMLRLEQVARYAADQILLTMPQFQRRVGLDLSSVDTPFLMSFVPSAQRLTVFKSFACGWHQLLVLTAELLRDGAIPFARDIDAAMLTHKICNRLYSQHFLRAGGQAKHALDGVLHLAARNSVPVKDREENAQLPICARDTDYVNTFHHLVRDADASRGPYFATVSKGRPKLPTEPASLAAPRDRPDPPRAPSLPMPPTPTAADPQQNDMCPFSNFSGKEKQREFSKRREQRKQQPQQEQHQRHQHEQKQQPRRRQQKQPQQQQQKQDQQQRQQQQQHQQRQQQEQQQQQQQELQQQQQRHLQQLAQPAPTAAAAAAAATTLPQYASYPVHQLHPLPHAQQQQQHHQLQYPTPYPPCLAQHGRSSSDPRTLRLLHARMEQLHTQQMHQRQAALCQNRGLAYTSTPVPYTVPVCPANYHYPHTYYTAAPSASMSSSSSSICDGSSGIFSDTSTQVGRVPFAASVASASTAYQPSVAPAAPALPLSTPPPTITAPASPPRPSLFRSVSAHDVVPWSGAAHFP